MLGYGDRIDRFYKGFDDVGIPFNLKEEWAAWLQARYGTLPQSAGGRGRHAGRQSEDFARSVAAAGEQVNASLYYPLAYDYILMQKKEIGEAQARWDAAVQKMAPEQIMWTPFEGCTLDWAMLDGFTPETKKTAGHLDGILPLAGDAPVAGGPVRGMGAHPRIRHPSQSRRIADHLQYGLHHHPLRQAVGAAPGGALPWRAAGRTAHRGGVRRSSNWR